MSKALDKIKSGLESRLDNTDIECLTYFEVLPPMSQRKLEGLMEALRENTVAPLIVYYKDGRIIDGNQRKKALLMIKERHPEEYKKKRMVDIQVIITDIDEDRLKNVSIAYQAHQRDWDKGQRARAIYEYHLENCQVPLMKWEEGVKNLLRDASKMGNASLLHVQLAPEVPSQAEIADLFDCDKATVSRGVDQGEKITQIIEIAGKDGCGDQYRYEDLWELSLVKWDILHSKVARGAYEDDKRTTIHRDNVPYDPMVFRGGWARVPRILMAWLFSSKDFNVRDRVLFKILDVLYGNDKYFYVEWKTAFDEEIGIDRSQRSRCLNDLEAMGCIERKANKIWINETHIEALVRGWSKPGLWTKFDTPVSNVATGTSNPAIEASVTKPGEPSYQNPKTITLSNNNDTIDTLSVFDTSDKNPSSHSDSSEKKRLSEEAKATHETWVIRQSAKEKLMIQKVKEAYLALCRPEAKKYEAAVKAGTYDKEFSDFIQWVLEHRKNELHHDTQRLMDTKYAHLTGRYHSLRKVLAVLEDLLTRSQQYDSEGRYIIYPWSLNQDWLYDFYKGTTEDGDQR